MAAISPEQAIQLAQASQELLRKDVLSGAVVIMGAAIIGLVCWVIWLQVRLSWVQDSRVADHKEGEARAEKLAVRMAVHMDRSTEATVLLLSKGSQRGRTRTGDVPITEPKKLPETAP